MADTPGQQSTETRNELLREMVVAIGIVAILLGVVGGLYWMQPGASHATHASAGTALAAATKTPETKSGDLARTTVAAPTPAEPVVHADIYFDFKSARLRADAAKLLQDKAATMKRSESWVMLLQGYTDTQGTAEYNRRLAQQRAETVKQFLVELGVPDTSIKVATVGPEAALCDDRGKECQQLNRRVHLEIRRLGPATTALTPANDDVQKP